MESKKEQILNTLRNVKDPELGRDVVEMGMIRDLQIDGNRVSFKFTLTTPACPVREQFEKDVYQTVKNIPWVQEVDIRVDAQIPKRSGIPAKREVSEVKHIVTVVSGKGGVGKSTVALNIAFALKELNARVGLLDADVYGPSLSRMAGAEGKILADDNKMIPLKSNGLKIMSIGFLTERETPVIWRGPIVHKALEQMLFDTYWGELDYLIMDLPPGTGDPLLSSTQLTELTGSILVTTPQDISIYDVRRAAYMLKKVNVPILGIVENMSYFKCPDCGRKHKLFGKSVVGHFSQEIDAPILGRVPFDPEIVSAEDMGRPSVFMHKDSPATEEIYNVAKKLAGAISTYSLKK